MGGSPAQRSLRRRLFSTIILSALTITVLLAWLLIYSDGYTSLREHVKPLDPAFDTDKSEDQGQNQNQNQDQDQIKDINYPQTSSAAAAEVQVPISVIQSTGTMTLITLPTETPSKYAPDSSSGDAPPIKLRQGTYSGIVLPAGRRLPKAIEAWRGIPFAESTAGPNRFRPPVPVGASDDIFSAASFGSACPGAGVAEDEDAAAVGLREGEDCLNVNVYRPQAPIEHMKLPVVIYVHGGAFNAGLGVERDMASFVSWAEDPMVGVNFNYRVGALGFLPSALTAKEGLLNLGLKDQQLLFQWVQENIDAFGGDPDNVTLMGLSAGAHSIGHHLMSYTDETAPFKRVIMESGAPTARAIWWPTHPRHLIQFREFLLAAGVEGVAEEALLDTLRTLPLSTIISATRAVWVRYEDSVCWPFQPVIDGAYHLEDHILHNATTDADSIGNVTDIIHDLPLANWLNGTHLRVPTLTGFNTNEGTLFIPPLADTNDEFLDFFKTLIPTLSDADLSALKALYPDPATTSHKYKTPVPDGYGRQWARLDAAYAHYAYICPVVHTAHFLSQSGAGGDSDGDGNDKTPPVYLYHFAARSSEWDTANHSDEAPVVAHVMDEVGDYPGLLATSEAMHGAWSRFVTRGDPNAGRSGADEQTMVKWPRFESPFAPSLSKRLQEAEDKAEDEGRVEVFKSTKGSITTTKSEGKLVLFGEGNNELSEDSGPTSPGTPAQVVSLSEEERAQCQFWWDLAPLSEGMGRRLS